MKRYRSHKTVLAVKIEFVGKTYIRTEDGEHVTFAELGTKSIPAVGDYFIVYEAGYKSFCPKKNFEDGYSEMQEEDK